MDKNIYKYLLLGWFVFSSLTHINGQNTQYKQYIVTYKDVAIEKMNKFKIPASITLAQGILESNAGNSYLAKSANNHFGIKCYDGWTGASVRKDDDRNNECFKKYKSASESFDDHSVFLQRDRYKNLYNLSTTDYKGWAHGLKAAGYATDKSYAYKLIKIIEDYQLYEYDRISKTSPEKPSKPKDNYKPMYTNNQQNQVGNNRIVKDQERIVYKNNGVKFVFVMPGDTYRSIANEFNVKEKNLYKFNDCDANLRLKIGDVVYLGGKKGKAEKPNFEYVVKSGDSAYSISQKFAIKVSSLYKMNKLPFGSSIRVGQVVRLR